MAEQLSQKNHVPRHPEHVDLEDRPYQGDDRQHHFDIAHGARTSIATTGLHPNRVRLRTNERPRNEKPGHPSLRPAQDWITTVAAKDRQRRFVKPILAKGQDTRLQGS